MFLRKLQTFSTNFLIASPNCDETRFNRVWLKLDSTKNEKKKRINKHLPISFLLPYSFSRIYFEKKRNVIIAIQKVVDFNIYKVKFFSLTRAWGEKLGELGSSFELLGDFSLCIDACCGWRGCEGVCFCCCCDCRICCRGGCNGVGTAAGFRPVLEIGL